MAIGLGLGLLGLMGLGHGVKRKIDENDRSQLMAGFNDALGTPAGLFDAGDPLDPLGQGLPGDDLSGVGQVGTPGTGLLADVNDPGNQLEFAKNLFGLPGGQALGENITEGVFNRGADSIDLASQLTAARERNELDNRVRTTIANDKLLSDEYFKAMELSQKFLDDTAAGRPDDPNMRRVVTGAGADDFVDVPKQGSADWNVAFLKNKNQESLVTDIDALGEMFSETGRFETGRQSGELQSLHTRILLQLKDQAELGVLSETDYELLLKLLPDPESWTSLLEGGTQEARIQGGIQETQKWAQRALGNLNFQTQHWGIHSDQAEQTPSQARRQKEFNKRQQAALDAGGTLVADDVVNDVSEALQFTGGGRGRRQVRRVSGSDQGQF